MINGASIYVWDLEVDISIIVHYDLYKILVIDLVAFSMSYICCSLSMDGSYVVR